MRPAQRASAGGTRWHKGEWPDAPSLREIPREDAENPHHGDRQNVGSKLAASSFIVRSEVCAL